jgi:exodeoxyribonuclease VII small subunit
MAAEGLGYEEARGELVEVVQRLEAGGATLEESLALWERGELLAGICQEHLDGARARLAAAAGRAAGHDDEGQDASSAPEGAG